MDARAAEPQAPTRPWLWPLIGWLLKRLAARRNQYGDERSIRVGKFWLHVYPWSYRSFGTGRWYQDWHALVGWPGGHRSFLICDAPEPDESANSQEPSDA